MNVNNLETAIAAYWAAKSRREEQAAYHEILLFGGNDGFLFAVSWRGWIAQQLRRLALRVEGRNAP